MRLTGTARAIALQTPTEKFSKKDGVKTLMDILNQHFKKDEEDVGEKIDWTECAICLFYYNKIEVTKDGSEQGV